MVTDAAQAYSAVFAPELFVLACCLLLVGYEHRARPDASVAGLGARVGVVALAWAAAFAVYQGVPVLLETVPAWGPDATGSVGLAVGMGVIWAGWRVRDWGALVPTFSLVLVAVTVPHLLITPFWDVSSHVTYALVPSGALALVSRRFLALVVVGVGMVAARPLAGAHTWLESIGGLVLSVAVLVILVRVRVLDSGPTVTHTPT